MSNKEQFTHNIKKAQRQRIAENENIFIDNIEDRENYILKCRPSFEATIKGKKYQISGIALGDVIEEIEIICLENYNEIYFEDKQLNKQIKEELYFILDNHDLYNVLGVV